jgi:hypothetical protein
MAAFNTPPSLFSKRSPPVTQSTRMRDGRVHINRLVLNIAFIFDRVTVLSGIRESALIPSGDRREAVRTPNGMG